ncbi:MAG: hypothetical protein AABW85_05250 [archaeon]
MKIDDFFIRKLSIAASAAGILILAIFLPSFSIPETQIKDISESTIGKEITVKGIIQNPQIKTGTLVFEITGIGKIRAVKIYPTKQETGLAQEGNFVEVAGTVKKYMGNLEIVAKSVKQID